MQLFKRDYYNSVSLKHKFESFTKSILLLIYPIPFAFGIPILWYFTFYKTGIHFDDGMEAILTAAWIPMFGIFYSIMAAIVVSTVWNEYKNIRTAVKRYDLETFVDLRDEEMSPLVHTLMLVLSLAVLLAFMGLRYTDPVGGMLLLGSTSYLFALIFFVVIEVDDPCSGLWFIKGIPEEWLRIDVKEWRKNRSKNNKSLLIQKDKEA